MSPDRRGFLGSIAAAGLAAGAGRAAGAHPPQPPPERDAARPIPARPPAPADRFDPWVEVEPAAIALNTAVVSRLAGGRPIMAVIKNNAYGLGLVEAAALLERNPGIGGFAVVKPEDALTLRDHRLRKPILLMGMAPDDAVADLVANDVHLSLYLDDDARRLPARAASSAPVPAHLYIDTGMGRMGIPFHRAEPLLRTIADSGAFRIDGMFTAFTEDPDFDPEQLRRFLGLADSARTLGIDTGSLHAASSNGVYHLPDAHLDLVRPGIALFGGYPSRPDEERARAELRPAFRLRARVVRVERLRTGDSVSYGRNYVASRPTWIATLPAGHADGYPRSAVAGARILIGARTFPVIGAVSASHIIVEVGDRPDVAVGDVATLLGPDHPDIHPNQVATASGGSVYDLFMHLNPALPRIMR